MTQLWAWEYEGKTEVGWKHWERTSVSLYVAQDSSVSPIRDISQVTNLRKVKVVDEDAVVIDPKSILLRYIKNDGTEEITIKSPTPPVTKTYLTTEQFIKVWQSLSDEKSRELSTARDAAWDAARSTGWYAVRDADLAVLVKDKITAEQFEILTKPWTSCGLSLFAEDWSDLINPVVISEGISND